MDYISHIVVMIGVYVILGIALNLLVGYGGLFSLTQAGLFGVGAYTAGLIGGGLHMDFLLVLSCAIFVNVVLGGAIGLLAIRARKDYFAVVTFAVQVLLVGLLNNLTELTNGPRGLAGIPRPAFLGHAISSHIGFVFLTLVFVALSTTLAIRVVNSPAGNILVAIREDEILAKSLGKNVAQIKVAIFAVSSGLSAISGVLYAYYIGFIDPSSFSLNESVFILSVVIVGGAGRMSGMAIGSALLVCIPELLRMLDLPHASAANFRQILYGGALVVCMMFRPKGLLGSINLREH